MFLRYYLGEDGRRVYTLKKTDPNGKETLSAHPARFSPEDNLRAFVECIRLLREICEILQFIRNSVPRTKLTYQQWTNRRLIVTFVMFFVGWKTFGVMLNDWLFWTVDEETGEGHMITPAEGRKKREELEREVDRQRRHVKALPKFDLDD
ncbi:unnamed protein product [Cylicocyclus nassatus]|uniref:Nucleolar protein 10 n=1 Tax=Cylicocyclus nassatus TaxID=53992 RepID=A0AA36GQF3_CYLNA|nr:unnamed protein product [Cylicocyclus nassatus]